MDTQDPIINRLYALKPRFPAMNLRRVRLFGSHARGDAKPDSDIDLLVEFYDMPSLFELADIKTELEKELGRDVDLVFPHKIFPELRAAILAEARDV